MKDDEYKGYYCLLIAILCNLNAAEASTMYEYGPDHPLCRKILKKKVRKPSIKKLKESEMAAAMKALLDQGYSQDAVSERTVQCVWTTDYFSFCGKVWKILYKVVQSLSYPEETQDFWFCAPDLSCQNVV